MIIDEDKLLLNLIFDVQQQNTKSVLTPILDFFLLSEIATMWQTDSAVYKLKLRSFHMSIHFQAHLVDFYPQCEPCLIGIIARELVLVLSLHYYLRVIYLVHTKKITKID